MNPQPPFRLLLGILTGVLLFAPLSTQGAWGASLVQLLLTAVLIAAIWTARGGWVRRGAALAVGALIVLTWTLGPSSPRLHLAALLVGTLALLLGALAAVAGAVARQHVVTLDTVLGACLAYLLFGIAFAAVYGLLILLLPGSLPLSPDGRPDRLPELAVAAKRFPDLLYFSFATLSTADPGPIVPAHPMVRAVTTLEAIIGQLYLAVLVARLVGLHLVHEAGAKTPAHAPPPSHPPAPN